MENRKLDYPSTESLRSRHGRLTIPLASRRGGGKIRESRVEGVKGVRRVRNLSSGKNQKEKFEKLASL